MATSGITTFELTRNEIIYAALRKLVAYGDGQTPTTTQIDTAAQALNAMLKTFQTDGMPLWAIKEYTFALTATSTYEIGIGKTLATPVPLKIIQARIVHITEDTSTPLNIYPRYDFNLLGDTSSTGYPVNMMYEPLAKYGIIKLWPVPDTTTIANYECTITYQRPFEDFSASTDTPDFPSYWTEALIYGLAWRLAPEYGIPPNDRKILSAEAIAFKDAALSFGTEEGSVFFQPDREGR
jgi:hypothetical protein